jgi:hypothetical protein
MSKTNKDQVIKVDGTILPIAPQNPKKGYSLEEMYRVIDTHMVQIVPTKDGKMIMVCDEEAMFNNKQYNPAASMAAGQHILGDVIVCANSHVK